MIPRDQRGVVLPLALTVLAVGAVMFYIGSLRHTPLEAVVVVALAAVVIALLPWALTRTTRYSERAYWASTPRQESVPPSALDYRLVRLRRDLRDAIERDDRPDLVHPLLRELAAERLLAHHDIDLDDPDAADAARARMDDQLWHYLTTPPTDRRKRSRSSLHAAIEGIEKL
ncbi:hypothetical protein ACQBAT_04215 [Ornithinimicrobium sp. Y1847]|uniref:hypothetical protein n=1 Tax=unclassified Ornithinimicrobium TaxID=2615080 RepID=UPI003B6841EC